MASYREKLEKIRMLPSEQRDRYLLALDPGVRQRVESDLFPQPEPVEPEPPIWQKSLNWLGNLGPRFGAVVTSPFTQDQPGMDTSGMPWWDREKAQYEATDMPSLKLGFNYPSFLGGGEASIGVKGAIEEAPFMIPAATPIRGVTGLARAARFTGLAKGLGRAAEAVSAVENIPSNLLKLSGTTAKGWILGQPKVAREVAEVGAEQFTGFLARFKEHIPMAAKATKETQELYKPQIAQRFGRFHEVAEDVPGFEGYIRAKVQLKGKYKAVDFTPMENVTENDFSEAWNYIHNRFGEERGGDKISFMEAVEKVVEGHHPEPKQVSLLGEVFGQDFVAELLRKRGFLQKAGDLALDIANFPRAVLASFDASAPLRQGLFFQAGHWKEATKGYIPMLKALVSEKNAISVAENIESHPFSAMARAAGLEMTSLPGKAGEMGAREEAFISGLVGKLPGIKQSAQAYNTYLNKLRMDVFSNVVDYWQKAGVQILDNDLSQLAKLINLGTGRGSLGSLDKHAGFLSTMLFSPKLQAARIQMPFMAFSSSALVRQEFRKDTFRMLGAGLSLLGLLKASGVADVETDMRSSDFAKIKIGNTRIDPWGGMQQYIRFLAVMADGKIKASGGDKTYEQERMDTALRFLQGKTSPAFGLLLDWIKGYTFLGEEFELADLGTGKQIRERLVPMVIQDVWDALDEEDSPLMGVVAGVPAFFGAGVASYGKGTWQEVTQMRETYNTTGKDWTDITKAQRNEIDKTPQLKALIDKLESDMDAFPGSKVEKAMRSFAKINDEEFKGEIESLAGALRNGQITWDEYNDLRSPMLSRRFGIKDLAFTMRAAFNDKTEDELGEDIRKYNHPFDNAMSDYKELMSQPIKNADGLIDWDATYARAEKHLDSLDLETRTYIRAHEHDWINDIGAEAQAVERERLKLIEILRPYWTVRGKIIEALPERARRAIEEHAKKRAANISKDPEWEQREIRRNSALRNVLKNVQSRVDRVHGRMRRDRKLDLAVRTWNLRLSSLE